jgi:hypothetical protein
MFARLRGGVAHTAFVHCTVLGPKSTQIEESVQIRLFRLVWFLL